MENDTIMNFYRLEKLAKFSIPLSGRGFEKERKVIVDGFYQLYDRIGYKQYENFTHAIDDLEDDIIQHIGHIPGELEDLVEHLHDNSGAPKDENIQAYKKFSHDAQKLLQQASQQPESRREDVLQYINDSAYYLWTDLIEDVRSNNNNYEKSYRDVLRFIQNG